MNKSIVLDKSKLDGNYARMLQGILNKSWKKHPAKQQLYGHLPLTTKTIQVRRTRHMRPCWRSKDEFIRDILPWTPSHGRAKAERPAKTYIQQLCADTECGIKDPPGAMDDRDGWRERVREICAGGVTWCWLDKNIENVLRYPNYSYQISVDMQPMKELEYR